MTPMVGVPLKAIFWVAVEGSILASYPLSGLPRGLQYKYIYIYPYYREANQADVCQYVS